MEEGKKNRSRLFYISFLQVVGPLLVILGHSTNGMPQNDILQAFKSWIYTFHMPLFFFISGYLFSYNNGLNITYKEFIKKKFLRLILPYLVFNLAFIIPKFLMSKYIVDEVELSISYIFEIMITPRNNIWGHLWFLFALFEIFLLAPLWDKIIKKNKKVIWEIVLLICVVLNLFPIATDILAISDLCKDTILFVIGLLIAKISIEDIKKYVLNRKIFYIQIPMYIGLIFLWIAFKNNVTTLLLCIFTIILLFEIPIKYNITNNIFDKIAKVSYTIYIIHWPVMLLTRVILYQILKINYLISEIAMIMAGIIIPIIIILVIKKIKEKTRVNSKIIHYLIGI